MLLKTIKYLKVFGEDDINNTKVNKNDINNTKVNEITTNHIDTSSITFFQEIFISLTKTFFGFLTVISFGYFTILSSRQQNGIIIEGSAHKTSVRSLKENFLGLNGNVSECNKDDRDDRFQKNKNDEIDSCPRKTDNLEVNSNNIKHMSVSSLYSFLSCYFNFAFSFMHFYLYSLLLFTSKITGNWNSNTNDYQFKMLQHNHEPQGLLYSTWFYCLLWSMIVWDTIFIFQQQNTRKRKQKKTRIKSNFRQFPRFLIILSCFILFNSSSYSHPLLNILDKVLITQQRTKDITNLVVLSPVIVCQYSALKFKELKFIRCSTSNT